MQRPDRFLHAHPHLRGSVVHELGVVDGFLEIEIGHDGLHVLGLLLHLHEMFTQLLVPLLALKRLFVPLVFRFQLFDALRSFGVHAHLQGLRLVVAVVFGDGLGDGLGVVAAVGIRLDAVPGCDQLKGRAQLRQVLRVLPGHPVHTFAHGPLHPLIVFGDLHELVPAHGFGLLRLLRCRLSLLCLLASPLGGSARRAIGVRCGFLLPLPELLRLVSRYAKILQFRAGVSRCYTRVGSAAFASRCASVGKELKPVFQIRHSAPFYALISLPLSLP